MAQKVVSRLSIVAKLRASRVTSASSNGGKDIRNVVQSTSSQNTATSSHVVDRFSLAVAKLSGNVVLLLVLALRVGHSLVESYSPETVSSSQSNKGSSTDLLTQVARVVEHANFALAMLGRRCPEAVHWMTQVSGMMC